MAFDCTSVQADETYLVPHAFGGQSFSSGSGEYFYRKTNCPFFVVDIYLNNQSNGQTPQVSGPGVEIGVGADDLPSSSQHGGNTPTVRWDCEHLTEFGFFYKRTSTTPQFALANTVNITGRWIDQGTPHFCQLLGNASLSTDKPPSANSDIYRAAIRVKERGSGQEVNVTVSPLAPH
jgi:hypothetical protein